MRGREEFARLELVICQLLSRERAILLAQEHQRRLAKEGRTGQALLLGEEIERFRLEFNCACLDKASEISKLKDALFR
jgi:hypothetical protein